MHPAALDDATLLDDCDETRTRRSGPGGQHRNKVETAVVLRHRPTGITAEASERRSQVENRAVAVQRLRLRLALEHRETAGDGPSSLWRSRAADGRLAIAIGHHDYPTLVAEALDHLQATGFRTAAAAAALGVTTTQLIGLFRRSAPAWTALTSARATAGLPRLA
jgi:hypothetical protein